MNQKATRFLFASFLICCSALPTANNLTVGVAFEYGDKYEGTVSRFRQGIELAKQQFEKSHRGIKISLKEFSYGLDLNSMIETGSKLADAGVQAVIGGESTLAAVALNQMLAKSKIVVLTPAPAKPKLIKDNPLIYTMGFTDKSAARLMAQYMLEKLKPKAVGIFEIYDFPAIDESEDLANAMEDFYKDPKANLPGIPFFRQRILAENRDYSEPIDFFKSHGVTHLTLFATPPNFASFADQAAKKNFFPIYIGGVGWGSNGHVFNRFVENSTWKDKFEAYRFYHWKEDSHSKHSDRFRSTFIAKYHQNPNAWNAIAYDAAWVLFTALSSAKNPSDRDQVREQLTKIQGMSLLTINSFSFGLDNNPKDKDLVIYRITQNGIHYETTIH